MNITLKVPDSTWSVSLTVVYTDDDGRETVISGLDNDFTDLKDGTVIDMTKEEGV